MGFRLGYWRRGFGATIGRSGPRLFWFGKPGCLWLLVAGTALAGATGRFLL